MSNPYGPKLETMEDWNEALGCCCPIRRPPEPSVEYERVRVRVFFPGVIADGNTFYLSRNVDYSESGYLHETWTQSWTAFVVGTEPRLFLAEAEINNDISEPFEGRAVITFSGPVDFDADLVAGRQAVVDYVQAGWASIELTEPTDGAVDFSRYELSYFLLRPRASFNLVRFRWQVPATWEDQVTGFFVPFTGTYFKITWDELYEPEGWNNEAIPEAERPVRFSRKDLTEEWEGPGSGDQDDPSWKFQDWHELELPEEPGERRIINIRYEHLRREEP